MNWIDKMEKKWGRYAIVNLSRYLVFAQIIGLVMAMAVPQVLSYMTFSGYDILHGQIWRLISWIFIPTASLDIFGLLFLFCVFMWGSQLESLIGTFRLNLFVWGGVLWGDIAGMIAYVLLRLKFSVNVSPNLTPYYILMSMLLAIAICLPDAEVRLYFVLPIKMKWMLVFELVYVGYAVVMCYVNGFQAYGSNGAGGQLLAFIVGTLQSLPILVPVLHMFWFFHAIKMRLSRKQRKRQKQFQSQMSAPRPGSGISMHKCAICGRTEITNPELEFRYCSKCVGNREYCQDHLFTHQHVR